MATAQNAVDERVRQFVSRVSGRYVSEQTADEYATWVRRFETWVPTTDPGLGELVDFDSFLADEDMIDYPWENARGRPIPDSYSHSSRVKAVSAAKLWLRVEYDNDVLDEVQNIVSGEPDPFDPKYLSEHDIEKTITEAAECPVDGCVAACRLTYDAIMRASELVQVSTDDIDFGSGTIKVHATKGSLDARIGLDAETLSALEAHIREQDVEEEGLVFKNSYGNSWNNRSWSSHFREHHHEAGAHSFGRHSPIVHRLESGESFGDVYRRARHKNPQTTARYARMVGGEIPDWSGSE